MNDASQMLAEKLQSILRAERRSRIVTEPGAVYSEDQIAAQDAWIEGKPFVVLTTSDSTRAQETQVIFGNGRTLIPIPIVVSLPYGIPTGTVSRATFDQSSATTAQLAQRLAALIKDLQSVGILRTNI